MSFTINNVSYNMIDKNASSNIIHISLDNFEIVFYEEMFISSVGHVDRSVGTVQLSG